MPKGRAESNRQSAESQQIAVAFQATSKTPIRSRWLSQRANGSAHRIFAPVPEEKFLPKAAMGMSFHVEPERWKNIFLFELVF